MAEVALGVGVGLSAFGSYKKGRAQKDSLDASAAQLRRNANIRRAASHRAAEDERDLYELIESDALATAAASGAGTDNVTVEKVLSDISAEGEYRAMAQMFAGEADALGYEAEAASLNKQGRSAKSLGTLGAAATILTGGSLWHETYG